MGAILSEALDRLDPATRWMVLLSDVEGFSHEEIAELAEIPVGTVKSRLHRARMALRRALDPRRSEGGTEWTAGKRGNACRISDDGSLPRPSRKESPGHLGRMRRLRDGRAFPRRRAGRAPQPAPPPRPPGAARPGAGGGRPGRRSRRRPSVDRAPSLVSRLKVPLETAAALLLFASAYWYWTGSAPAPRGRAALASHAQSRSPPPHRRPRLPRCPDPGRPRAAAPCRPHVSPPGRPGVFGARADA